MRESGTVDTLCTVHASQLPDRIIQPLQKPENAVHLTGHKDSGTKQILQEKGVPPGQVLRDRNSGIFLSCRDIWHVCLVIAI